jgi:hypothetical protein
VLDEVVDGDEHVEVPAGLVEVVLEDADAVDGDVDYFLEGVDVEGEGGEFVEAVGGDDLLGGLDDVVEQPAGGRALVNQYIFSRIPD